jgi:predicted DNA-binding transcriptional regulator AlpA
MTEPVGVVEIAEMLGVTRDAVNQWRRRDTNFPEPKWTVGGRPAWNRADIETWARATHRLHD